MDDVDAIFRARADAAKSAYDAEMTKVNRERMAGMRLLLSAAMRAEDLDKAITIKKRIDELQSQIPAPPPTASPNGSSYAIPASEKDVIFVCGKHGTLLPVFGFLKHEVKASINQLTAQQPFNVVFYSDEGADPLFKDGLRFATSADKEMAFDFIDNEVASGGTLPIPAINFALKEKPDLLCVLDDGCPNVASMDDVVAAFKQGNPDGKVQTNYLFIQSEPGNDSKLEQNLKQISDDGHGTFKKYSTSDVNAWTKLQ
jgi:hypothetical protein